MSAAANGWLRDRPLLTVLLSFLGSLILAFTVRAYNISDEKEKEINVRISKKADKEWVEDNLKAHEATDAARYQGIKDMFVITSGQLKDIKEDIREIRKNQN